MKRFKIFLFYFTISLLPFNEAYAQVANSTFQPMTFEDYIKPYIIMSNIMKEASLSFEDTYLHLSDELHNENPNFHKAEYLCDKCIRINDKYEHAFAKEGDLYYIKGYCLFNMRRMQDAIAILKLAKRHNSKQAAVLLTHLEEQNRKNTFLKAAEGIKERVFLTDDPQGMFERGRKIFLKAKYDTEYYEAALFLQRAYELGNHEAKSYLDICIRNITKE